MPNQIMNATDNPKDPEVQPIEIVVYNGRELDKWIDMASADLEAVRHPDHDLRWLRVLARSMSHRPYLIQAVCQARTVGLLPLAFVQSFLFGRFLVSLPYVNSAGVQTLNADVGSRLVEAAARLTDELDCRFLELRHEEPVTAACLTEQMTAKVHMRLRLPATVDELRDGLKSKVRSQVKKGEAQGFEVRWGREELLPDFYELFVRRMRDLGTPVYGRGLFRSILQEFPSEAEICCIRSGKTPVAAALLIHGAGLTEVPSASSLSQYNPLNVNMFMYWQLLARAVERGQETFDFGRATRDGNTFSFKKQWGAEPSQAVWQYYVRKGTCGDMRPTGKKTQAMIGIWQHLPLWLTRLIGPKIVRGIP